MSWLLCSQQCMTEILLTCGSLLCDLSFTLRLGSLIAMAIQNGAAMDISLHDRSLCSIATPRREAEIIGFIKGEPNKTLAFMPRYKSAVCILLFHRINTQRADHLQVNTHAHTHTHEHTQAHGNTDQYSFNFRLSK